jgi:hypothetical protein
MIYKFLPMVIDKSDRGCDNKRFCIGFVQELVKYSSLSKKMIEIINKVGIIAKSFDVKKKNKKMEVSAFSL